MDIKVQSNSPFSVRDQIKRQIRLLIESGEINPGHPLPSARDLSAILQVNRNTVTHAYKELSAEGLLEIVVGSGTFVKEELALKPKKALDRVFDKAIQNAGRIGFNTEEIAEHFMDRLSALTADVSKKRIVVVDCNDEIVQYLCDLLSKTFGVSSQGILIQEIEADRTSARGLLNDKDLIVCGFNHLEELKCAVPRIDTEVVAILLQVDVRVINSLAQLPKGTKVGFVCANQRSTETLYNSAYFAGAKELRRILAGYDNSKQLHKVIRGCDVIFATNFVYHRLTKLTTPEQQLINVKITVDSSSMELVKEKLQR
jgi:DNA-binding transcriptional regulator YhcF (GntR family)